LRRKMMRRDHRPPTGHESRQHGLLRRALFKEKECRQPRRGRG
jgi:hypothetical protein